MEEQVISKELIELYSDLVKIGIPSLIALIGAISSFLLATKNIKKDIKIENLRIDKELEAKRNERKGALIQDASDVLTELQSYFIKYGSSLAAKIETLEAGESYPQKEAHRLSTYYDQLNKAMRKGAGALSKLHLLGDSDAIQYFNVYWSSVTGFSMNYAPRDNNSYQNLMKEMLIVKQNHEAVFSILSDIYLLKKLYRDRDTHR